MEGEPHFLRLADFKLNGKSASGVLQKQFKLQETRKLFLFRSGIGDLGNNQSSSCTLFAHIVTPNPFAY